MTSIEKEFIVVLENYLEGSEDLNIAKLLSEPFPIRIEGDKWSGYIDKTIVTFYNDVDRIVKNVLADYDIAIPKNKNPILIKLDEGSSLVNFDWETIKTLINGVDIKSKLIIGGTIIACVTGVPAISGYYDIKKKEIELDQSKSASEERVETAKIVSEERLQVIAALSQNLSDNAFDIEKPRRTIVNAMEDGDTLSMGTNPTKASKSHLKKTLTKTKRNIFDNFFVDHTYIVENLETKPKQDWRITLRYGDVLITNAVLKLDVKANEKLQEAYTTARAKQSSVAVKLQVTIKINLKKDITEAIVIGVGEARDKALSFDEVYKIVDDYQDNNN